MIFIDDPVCVCMFMFFVCVCVHFALGISMRQRNCIVIDACMIMNKSPTVMCVAKQIDTQFRSMDGQSFACVTEYIL